ASTWSPGSSRRCQPLSRRQATRSAPGRRCTIISAASAWWGEPVLPGIRVEVVGRRLWHRVERRPAQVPAPRAPGVGGGRAPEARLRVDGAASQAAHRFDDAEERCPLSHTKEIPEIRKTCVAPTLSKTTGFGSYTGGSTACVSSTSRAI